MAVLDLLATGYEVPFMSRFRWVMAVLDLLYVFLALFQKRKNGKYPASRFDSIRSLMYVHILCGAILLYTGTFLHIQNEISAITKSMDTETYRQVIYYGFSATGILHSLTVIPAIPKVMGEKRLTIPLYCLAGVINMINSIALAIDPNLKHAFLLWGSVNTFVFVRAYFLTLSFAEIDFELLYTVSLVLAGWTTYPLTNQDARIYYLLLVIIFYAPFHEHIVRHFHCLGFTLEDELDGNNPSEKNISSVTTMFRENSPISVKKKNDAPRAREEHSVALRSSIQSDPDLQTERDDLEATSGFATTSE